MNKAAKAGIAAAIAGILLLGSAGTYALWQDTQTVNAGTVSTGTLKLELGTPAGSWQDVSADVAGAPVPFNPATDKLVPGDTLKFTQPVKVTATGKNLAAQLTIDKTSLTTALGAVAPYVTVDVAPGTLPSGVTNNAGVLAFVPAATTYTFDVSVTLAFALGDATAGNDESAMTKDLNLNALVLKLEQVRP